jgi:hypothetical protein
MSESSGGRELVEKWARWCGRTPTGMLGFGRNPIAVLMQYGVRVGASKAGDEPERDATMARVDAMMRTLCERDYAVWASLMARHRNAIGGETWLGVWHGGLRRMTAVETAERLAAHLGESPLRARKRLEERCRRGYRLIDGGLTPASFSGRKAYDVKADSSETRPA